MTKIEINIDAVQGVISGETRRIAQQQELSTRLADQKRLEDERIVKKAREEREIILLKPLLDTGIMGVFESVRDSGIVTYDGRKPHGIFNKFIPAEIETYVPDQTMGNSGPNVSLNFDFFSYCNGGGNKYISAGIIEEELCIFGAEKYIVGKSGLTINEIIGRVISNPGKSEYEKDSSCH